MATPPTFEAEYEVAPSTVAAGARTVSVTVSTGDVLVIYGVTEADHITLGTPTGGGLTYTLQQSVVVTDYCGVYVWTAVSASSQTYTLSITMAGGTAYWGYSALRFSGSDGVGASSKTNVLSGAPSLALTTGADNSAVVAAVGDWNASDGASRTWRTVNSITPTAGNNLERTYARDASRATFYGAYWNDAATAGSKTTGLSAPSGQKYSIIAVEVEGTAGGGTDATATPATIATVAALPRPAGNVAAAPATVATTDTLPRSAVNTVASPAVTATATALPQATPVVAGNATAAPATVVTAAALPRPAVNVVAGPATVATATALPRPAASVVAAPAAVTTTAALPRPAANATAGPAPVATATTFPAAAVNVTVGATAITTTVSLPTPSVGGSTTATPATVTGTVSLPRPAVNVAAAPAPVPVVTSLPQVSAGTPDAGIVIRPNTGTTTRPSTGLVTRPYTGVVTRP